VNRHSGFWWAILAYGLIALLLWAMLTVGVDRHDARMDTREAQWAKEND
jgi:hypothetical protein